MAVVLDNQVHTEIAATTVTWVLTAAADIAVDDLLVAVFACANATAAADPQPYPSATDWDELEQNNEQFADVTLSALWKIADASDAAASDFTFTINTTASPGSGHIIRFTGADAADPIGASSEARNTSGATVVLPSVTTTVADSMLVALGATDDASDRNPSWANPTPTGFTAVWGSADPDAEPGGSFVASMISTAEQAAIAASGDKTITLNFNRQKNGVLFVVNPGAAVAAGLKLLGEPIQAGRSDGRRRTRIFEV